MTAKRGSVLMSAALGAALTPLNSTMVAVALPALSREFGAPAATVTLFVVTGYLVATIIAQLPAGSTADRIGYVRALTWGRWMFGCGAAAGAFAPSLLAVVAGRLLMAVGGALIVPTAMALVRIAVPAERRARAFGVMGAVMGGAAAVGPALGAFMTDQFGWRWLFVINVPLLLISWLLQPPVPDVRQADASRRFGWLGVALFRNRPFVASAGVIATQNLAMYSLLIQVPFLFGGGAGTDTGLGVAIIAMTLTMAAISPLGGWLVEWVGVKAVTATGGLIAAGGVIGLASLPATAPARQVGSWLLLVGLGLGLSTGPANASAMTAVPQEQSAIASATVSMMRYLGAIAGTGILSFALVPGAEGTARQHVALWFFVGALVASAALGLMLPPLPGRRYLRDRANARAS